jgi:lysyl-tRNA synthetase class 2
MRRIRHYFEQSGALEVDTPALSPQAVSDPQIESFCIESSQVSPRPLFLQTSPEFCMKRLLAAGYPDIYSICRVYRDGEVGGKHQPEFTMIEWYRLDAGLNEIIDDTVRLVSAVLDSDAVRLVSAVLDSDAPEVVCIDYADAIHDACGLDIASADVDALARAAEADDDLRVALGKEKDDWLDLLLATRVISAGSADRVAPLSCQSGSAGTLVP